MVVGPLQLPVVLLYQRAVETLLHSPLKTTASREQAIVQDQDAMFRKHPILGSPMKHRILHYDQPSCQLELQEKSVGWVRLLDAMLEGLPSKLEARRFQNVLVAHEHLQKMEGRLEKAFSRASPLEQTVHLVVHQAGPWEVELELPESFEGSMRFAAEIFEVLFEAHSAVSFQEAENQKVSHPLEPLVDAALQEGQLALYTGAADLAILMASGVGRKSSLRKSVVLDALYRVYPDQMALAQMGVRSLQAFLALMGSCLQC